MAQKPQKRVRPLADMVGPVLGPVLAAQGFTGHDIVASWPEIVGERLASASRPVKVDWPRRRPGENPGARSEPATLQVRVESAFALEVQHLAPLLMERINAIYGWRCIGRIVLKQGPVGRKAAPKKARPQPSEADRLRVAEAVRDVESDALRDALSRLGTAITAATSEPDAMAGLSLPQSS